METLICRILMVSGVIVGVLLAGGQGDHALVPAAAGGPDFSSAMSRNPYGDDPRCN